MLENYYPLCLYRTATDVLVVFNEEEEEAAKLEGFFYYADLDESEDEKPRKRGRPAKDVENAS